MFAYIYPDMIQQPDAAVPGLLFKKILLLVIYHVLCTITYFKTVIVFVKRDGETYKY